ncbi:Bug family tripartite tricarboxylate transporter substrate binding protein [Neoroseomonas lacus]|uniref:ABC transporter substrate-binding protein n=1 Tax=Neoroseomonas lacus TaxID=287609 RepID=A0A917KJD3_9PROT|nr:tripartite tricarboxylate transporter substrate binding protein [Neoroseomonas lacus]GGJ12136.1 ABC transporter substrate-binding protein [Neoroseomonas lacus]
MRQEETNPSAAVRRRRLLGGLSGLLAMPAIGARAGAWPEDRVTIITSLPAGSTVDLTTRVYADQLARMWGKAVVVDNRGGGNGVLACQMVARARPDGLTLLATSAMTHAANPSLYARPPYDAVADFDAVARYGASPFVVMAYKGLGTHSLAALTRKLRDRPGDLSFGAGSVPSRLASELYRQLIDADAVHVGYRGNQAGYPDLLNGRIAFMAVDVVGAKPLVDRGEVDAIALSDDERHPAVPEVPTSAEAGLPDYRFTTWSGMYAPKNTPREIVARIHADMTEAYALPEVRARILGMGGSQVPPMGPDAFQAFTIQQIAAWGRIIRQAGITIE